MPRCAMRTAEEMRKTLYIYAQENGNLTTRILHMSVIVAEKEPW